MGHIRTPGRLTVLAVALLAVASAIWFVGCSQSSTRRPATSAGPVGGRTGGGATATGEPIVRVRIFERQSQVTLTANQPPLVHTDSDPTPKTLNLPPGIAVQVSLSRDGWRIGNAVVGRGPLVIRPAVEGPVAVNNSPYRGEYRFVPVSAGEFDVVNHVGIEGYLKSVVSREMLRDWELEAYKAQAIIARTYGLYEARTGALENQHFDLHADVRSQVYGGIKSETDRSRQSVDETAGVVVVHGAPGQERIFKAYFSSCCGGISQSAFEAFGDAPSEPLSEQNVGASCNISKHFNWGPIVVSKDELTKRFKGWGAGRKHPIQNMARVANVRVASTNRFGRPVRFEVTDARGNRYLLKAEELRWSVNHNASSETRLKSSFCKPLDQGDAIHFVEGHGYGHGVGMCQWCCQARALAGWAHEDMVLRSYAGSKLARAY